MKLSRNSLCPCGSGKKFKKCHLNSSDITENPQDEIPKLINRYTKKSKIFECIYPRKAECSDKIINAHSIPNGKILKKLAKDGHVIMPQRSFGKYENEPIKVELSKVSKNTASTFNGFCAFHDNLVFKSIDDYKFMLEERQVFLLSYRSLAREYIVKKQALKMQRLYFADFPQKLLKSGFVQYSLNPHELSVKDNEVDLRIFNDAILKDELSILEYIIFKLDYEVNFATSFATEIEKDLNSNMLNDIFELSENYKAAKAFINIFPDDGSSYIVFACLKNEYDIYRNYFHQLKNLYNNNINKFKNYVTNLVVRNSENIVIGNVLWEHFKSEGQVTRFNEDWNNTLEELMSPLLSMLNFNNDMTISRGYSLFFNVDKL